jgi:hypothetical protein
VDAGLSVQWMPLAQTLEALVDSVAPELTMANLMVTEAELRVPLEIRPAVENGRLVFLAQPPHTRWRSGFLPSTHMSRLVIRSEAG